jgi:group I intron endonuclease
MKKYNMKGIYQIRCVLNDIVYIGSTNVSFDKRWSKHKYKLRSNTHENEYLQKTWNNIGEDNFVFEILENLSEIDDIEYIRSRESFYLTPIFNKGRLFCFNLSDHINGGNTVKDPEINIKFRNAIKESYNDELREIRRDLAYKNNNIQHALCKVNTPEWKIAHKNAVQKLAKDPSWIKKMKDLGKLTSKKVGNNIGESFASITEASLKTGCARSSIRNCINGKIKTSKGRIWFYI